MSRLVGGRRSSPEVGSRRGRLVALLVALVLMLAGCDGGAAKSVDASADADPYPEGLIPVTFEGEPPIWPLSEERTNEIVEGIYSILYREGRRAFAPVAQRCAAIEHPESNDGLITGVPGLEDCLRPYLEELGVGAKALELFFATSLVIREVEATGPFWLATAFPYDMYMTNGSAPEYLITTSGILTIPGLFTHFQPSRGWDPVIRAIRLAQSTPPVPEIRAAYAEHFDMAVRDIAFHPYGEKIDLSSAEETDWGWSVPFTWELLACHACDTPIYGRFALDLTPEGVPWDVRFIDVCYQEGYATGGDTGDVQPGGSTFGLETCVIPHRYVG